MTEPVVNNNTQSDNNGASVASTQPDNSSVISDLQKQIADLKAMLDNANKQGGDVSDNDPIKKAQAIIDKNKQDEQDAKVLENAISFNVNVDKFVDDNKSLLPENTSEMLAIIKNTAFSTQIEEERNIKMKMLDNFFQYQDNVNLINTESGKKRLAEYKSLANKERLTHSTKYWDLIENAIELKATQEKMRRLNLDREGKLDGNSSIARYNKKFFDANKQAFRNINK